MWFEVVALGGLAVSVLTIGPAEDYDFLMAIKVYSTTSFGGEEKLLVPCRKIVGHVKEPYRYEKRYFVGKIHGYFSPRQVSPASLVDVSGVYCLWWMNQNYLNSDGDAQ